MLKGTYKLNKKMKTLKKKREQRNPFEKFEIETLKQLGGSIAFVSKAELLWKGNENEEVK